MNSISFLEEITQVKNFAWDESASGKICASLRFEKMVDVTGIEPATPCLQSDQDSQPDSWV
jgi:hypothetical protein